VVVIQAMAIIFIVAGAGLRERAQFGWAARAMRKATPAVETDVRKAA
jgi:hypothetical protein